MPRVTKHGQYCIERFDAPLHGDIARSVDKLCNGFGDHYKTYFGPDFIERMTNEYGGAVVYVAYLENSNHISGIEDRIQKNDNIEICAAASILYDPDDRKGVATLHNVFTHIEHRRQGLSKILVRKVIELYDREIGGSFCVLGTGSPFAAKTYQENGFGHLAGGFDTNGPKGYNPDDLGEWIMIRPARFDPVTFYSIPESENLCVIPVKREHYTQLVLLFNARDEGSESKKCLALDIETGIQAEEKLIKFFQSSKFRQNERTLCYVAVFGARVHGVAAYRDDTSHMWDTYACENKKLVEDRLRQEIYKLENP